MNTFEKVYLVTSFIPKGFVLTYKKVAELASVKNARIVGFALHNNKNPHKVPCHRVVNVKGELTGYAFGGIKKKKEILEKEGAKFLNDERVDLDKSLFKPTLEQLKRIKHSLKLEHN